MKKFFLIAAILGGSSVVSMANTVTRKATNTKKVTRVVEGSSCACGACTYIIASSAQEYGEMAGAWAAYNCH